MTKQLTVIAGRDEGRVFVLPDEGTFEIGRGSTTPTRLNDLRVSRNHCELEITGDQVLITDKNSSVGTFVNDQRLTAPQPLFPGDVIKIGDTELRFQDDNVADLKTMAGFAIQDMLAASTASEPRPAVAVRNQLEDLTGTRLGPYEVGPILTQGNTSVLFRARDPAEDRTVALKVLRPEFTRGDGDMQRLARAVRPLLELRHPHLVALHGVGKTSGHCWIAQELVEGETLTQVIQRVGLAGMLDWQHALRVALHMAQALDYLHKNRVVHNNITPDNILINTADKRAQLGGLVRARTPEGDGGEVFAKPGEFLRDIVFMPPERARDNNQGDARSDIYSLGATLYALLAGRPPFQGRTPVETIVQIIQAEPTRPREFQLSLPEGFERAVLRMLAKDPKQRYQTGAELLADLERATRPASAPADRENGRVATPAGPSGEKGIAVMCACGQKLNARERFAGTRVRCPACGAFLLLPGQPPLAQPAPPPATAAAPPARPAAPGQPAESRFHPAVAGVVVLAVLALLAVVASLFWSKDTSPTTPHRPKKSPAGYRSTAPDAPTPPAGEP